jgi:hypothetical protein
LIEAIGYRDLSLTFSAIAPGSSEQREGEEGARTGSGRR